MVKRILKIVAIVLAGFVVVVGAAIGITALTGGFDEEKILIDQLFFDGDVTKQEKQIKTLEDIVVNVNCTPANATNKELIVKVLDNENGIIANVPSKVTAGEDFTLKIGKDDKGNNIGGVVTIQFSQDDNIVDAKLKVVVDVAIPDNSLYFTGDNSGKITTTGKSFTMAISNNQQYVYLRSELINAFFLKSGTTNLKNTQIGYTYYKADGSLYETKDLTSQLPEPQRSYNALENVYNYYYKIPLVTDIAGTVDIWARTHRTSDIQEAFITDGFDNIITILENQNNSNADKERASILLAKYNDFINKYIQYFDTSAESYAFFKNAMSTSGRITLGTISQVRQSLDFVYVTCHATINVTAIKLDDFTSLATPKPYNVFDNKLYSISGNYAENIVDSFNLEIITDNESASGVEEEKDYMFEGLSVKPYLYLDKGAVDSSVVDDETSTLVWQGRTYTYLNVYGFNEHTPIIEPTGELLEEVGYLIHLVSSDEYINISQLNIYNEKHWRVNCNIPLPNDQKQANDIYKALYIGFEVSGISADTGEVSAKQTFTRIYINYEDYDFVSDEINNLAINDLDPYMSINTSDILINEGSKYEGKLTSSRYIQNLSMNLEDYVDNMDTVSYKNVMYFVEQNSNTVDTDSSKVATIGKYKFINFTNVNNSNLTTSYYQYADEDLVGQRIPTFTTTTDKDGNIIKNYYLQALNASTEPVRVFAVVYLCDKDGYPIDVNGRRVNIDEGNQGDDIPSLVVIRISDITEEKMPQVYIESFVDTINFYTESVTENTVGGVVFPTGYLNRNHINYYTTEEGNVDADALQNIQDYLRLKLLKNNYFTLFVTNMELDTNGTVIIEENKSNEISIKDIFGTDIVVAYTINTNGNKQLAFNNLCQDLNNYRLYIGSSNVDVYDNPVVIGDGVDGEWVENGNATMIRWYLHSSADNNSNANPVIYLDPTSSSIPYSTALIPSSTSTIASNQQVQKNNYVLFDTYKLIVNDVILDDNIDMQNTLYARYANAIKSNGILTNSGELEFKQKTPDGTGVQNYSLRLENGNIAYKVDTNLIGTNTETQIPVINLEFVDCSQAIMGMDTDEDLGDFFFSSIYSYINYYTKNVNYTNVLYTATDGMMSFAEDFRFTNENQDGTYGNEIHFGTKSFPISQVGDYATVNINGYVLELERPDDKNEELWALFIERGTYFPMIEGDKALIFNEIFNITYTDDNGKINYYILEFVKDGVTGEDIKINKYATLTLSNGQSDVEYDVSKYLDDYSTDSKSSAIKVVNDNLATVNFIQGEEIGRFVEDNNGLFKKVINANNQNEYSYVRIGQNEDYTGTRYSIYSPSVTESKEGVKVYLLITFPVVRTGNGSEFTFYKAIEYELLQEEIEVVAYNNVGAIDELENSGINSRSNPLKIHAGKSTKIYLSSPSNTGAYIDIKASNAGDFFGHVSFKVNSSEVSGIVCEQSNDYINITVPDIINDAGFSIIMSYPYKGQVVEEYFYITAKANIVFTPGSTVSIKQIDEDTSVYDIKLNAGEYIIKDLFSENFVLDYNITDVMLTGTGVNGSKLTVNSSYADYDGSDINYDAMMYNITLKLSNGKSISLTYKLYVEIIPDYVVDLNQLKSTITLFNGDSIFANYVRLFNGNIALKDITDTNNILSTIQANYSDLFTITTDEETLKLIETDSLENGIIKLKNTPTEDKNLTFNITYPGLTTPLAFTVKVRGIVMNYSSIGQVQDNPTALNNNISISIDSGSSVEVDDYLEFTLATESIDVSVVAVLVKVTVDEDTGEAVISNPISKLDDIDSNAEYRIAYARTKSGSGSEAGIEIVEVLDYTFTININN